MPCGLWLIGLQVSFAAVALRRSTREHFACNGDVPTVTPTAKARGCILQNMQAIYRTTLLLVLSTVSTFVCVADGQTAGQNTAEQLRIALGRLQKAPDDTGAQQKYIHAFPHDFASFVRMFDLGKPLYDGHEYLEVFSSLGDTHEDDIGSTLTSLCSEARYDADAPEYLQQATAVFGSRHTEKFLSLLKAFPARKQAHIIKFLTDGVEDFAAYPEYQRIIDHSNSLGETAMAEQFETARTRRTEQPKH
jgi:hypothetical protein